MHSGWTGNRFRGKAACAGAFALWLGLGLAGGASLAARAQAGSNSQQDVSLMRTAAAISGAGRVSTGVIQGIITDADEAAISDAHIVLRQGSSASTRDTMAAADGSFVLADVAPGVYAVTIEREGFAPWHGTATLAGGEHLSLPGVALQPLAVSASIEVRASTRDIAEAQLGLEEKQRVLGVFPNFYASYVPDAEPLSAGQKFRLAWRFVNDPVALGLAGVTAASEQRANVFPGYGQGAAGYSKRYGAAYADGFTSTFLGEALLPAVFHQDPRYFVKGTGSVGSRVLYAMASMVICKGDNRRWQPNYSNVLGNFASASLSNVYYPAASRGATLIVTNASVATLMGAVGGLFQEFLLHRMTPGVPEYGAMR